MIRIACLDDVTGWGRGVSAAARRRGHSTVMFQAEAADGAASYCNVAFMRPDRRPPCIAAEQAAAEHLRKRGVRLVPSIRFIRMHLDRLRQTQELARWLPPTVILGPDQGAPDPTGLGDLIDRVGGCPFLSAGPEPSAPRVIHTPEAALRELVAAFAPGIQVRGGAIWREYLIWQRFSGLAYCYRIQRVGDELAVSHRYRPDRVIVSGSGELENITPTDPEAAEALRFAARFCEEELVGLGEFDVVRNNAGGWHVLGFRTGWETHGPAWQARRFMSGRSCRDLFDVIAAAIETEVL